MRSGLKLISGWQRNWKCNRCVLMRWPKNQRADFESIKQADSAVKLAHERFSALAAENGALEICNPKGNGPEKMTPTIAYEECHRDEVPELDAAGIFHLARQCLH